MTHKSGSYKGYSTGFIPLPSKTGYDETLLGPGDPLLRNILVRRFPYLGYATSLGPCPSKSVSSRTRMGKAEISIFSCDSMESSTQGGFGKAKTTTPVT